MPSSSYAALDDALDLLAGHGSALMNGNFNHAPMVAEALCALDCPGAVVPWLERYRARLLPRPPDNRAVGRDHWRDELGRDGSFAAWCDFFSDELAGEGWPQVLDRWIVRLAPGASAAATHGVIRVGHAVRAVAAGETPARRRELADALASWAESYRELPPAPADGAPKLALKTAVAAIPVVPPARRPAGNITTALAALGDIPEFAPAVAAAELDGDPAVRLVELSELFARLYLANARDIASVIAFIHGVTSLTAIGHIVPHVGTAASRPLLWYGWQAGCGLYACYGRPDGRGADIADSPMYDGDPDALIERAVANGDEHVIKFTEACLARNRIAPSPVYPVAIVHAQSMIRSR